MSVAFADHVGPWTIADLEALPDAGDHSRYELLTPGVLTVTPAPGVPHQRVSYRLRNLLEKAAAAAGASVEVFTEINVTAPNGRLAIPDIAVVDRDFAATDPTYCPPEAILAIIEIVSPGSEPQDRLVKPQLYADAGIPVYWRFELAPPHIILSELDPEHGQLVPTLTATAGQLSIIPQPFHVELDPAALIRP